MTIFFPDVSHYQAGLRLAGAPAVIAKTTQGVGYVDGSYLDFEAQAATLGIPFCAYHWVDDADLAAQAAHAYKHTGSTPMMWDAEDAGATVPRLAELTQRYRALGGVVHLVYLPHWWWQSHLGSPSLAPLAALGLSVVSSNYPSSGYAEGGPGWAPYGGVTPVQWQYADSHLFNGSRVDFNAYRGTASQWAALISGADMALTVEDRAAIRAEVLAALSTPVPWQSAGVSTWATAHGWRPVSSRAALEYVWQQTLALGALDLQGRLDAILAAAQDDGNTTVVMDPAALAQLQQIRDDIAAAKTSVIADARDAVADLGEGGAAQVRAPQN